MTRQQRCELRTILDRIVSNSGLSLDIAYRAASGKKEADAVDQIRELMVAAQYDINDLQALLDEICESPYGIDTPV